MLIRPQQAFPLARNNRNLLILLIIKNISKILGIHASLSDLYQEKVDNPYNSFAVSQFVQASYLNHCRGSKFALLHRDIERKSLCLSD